MYISIRDLRIPSLEPGDYEKDERLDRSILGVALGIVGGGMAFLLGMVFFLFPEWIRPIAFGPGFSEPGVHAVHLRPDAAADTGGNQKTLFHQARNLLIDNLSIDGSVPLPDTAQTPDANQPVSVNPPTRGQTSAQATPASTGQTFGRGGDNTASQPLVLPRANAWAVPVPNNGTRIQQRQSNVASLGLAAARHPSGKKLA